MSLLPRLATGNRFFSIFKTILLLGIVVGGAIWVYKNFAPAKAFVDKMLGKNSEEDKIPSPSPLGIVKTTGLPDTKS